MGFLRHLKKFLKAILVDLPLARQLRRALLAAVRHLKQSSAARLHDIFNLVAIGALNVLNFANFTNPNGFMPIFVSSLVYFLVDILYIAIAPNSVKAPASILLHHLITAAYMAVPYSYPEHRWLFPWALLVEVNTWLQIARRTLPVPLLDPLFYLSWVALRLVMYPALMGVVFHQWIKSGVELVARNHTLLLASCMQTFLTGMNYYWTAELLVKMSARRQRKVAAVRSKDKPAVAAQVHLEARTAPAPESGKRQQ